MSCRMHAVPGPLTSMEPPSSRTSAFAVTRTLLSFSSSCARMVLTSGMPPLHRAGLGTGLDLLRRRTLRPKVDDGVHDVAAGRRRCRSGSGCPGRRTAPPPRPPCGPRAARAAGRGSPVAPPRRGELAELGVVSGVPDEDAASEAVAGLVEEELAVNAPEGVVPREVGRVGIVGGGLVLAAGRRVGSLGAGAWRTGRRPRRGSSARPRSRPRSCRATVSAQTPAMSHPGAMRP